MPDLQFQANLNRPDDLSENSWKGIKGLWVVRLILAGMVTLAGIQYSLLHGRLLRQPVGDDAIYMVDSLHRLHALYDHGFWGLVRSLISDPPHSPFSSLLGMVSFVVFGRHEWAPYAGNAVIVLALLTAVDWVAGDVKGWQRGLIYALVLCTRWPWTAVTEFRPDLACGLASAVAVLYCLRNPLIGSSLGHRIGIGAMFGLVLLMKPAMLPIYCVILGVCLLTALAIDSLLRSRRPMGREIVSSVFVPTAAAILVMAPYYAFAWKDTWDYFYSNVFGNRKELWWFKGTMLEHFRYYLDLPHMGGNFVLGIQQVYLLLALAVIGLLMVLTGRNREHRFRAAGLVVVGATAFAIPAAAKVKNLWFGAGFQTLLILGAVLILRRLIARRKLIATGGFFAFCIAGICMFKLPIERGSQWEFPIVNSSRLLNQVYTTIEKEGQLGDRIYIPAPGMSVSWNTMNYMSLSDDSLRRFANLDFGKWDDLQLIQSELDQADWVVVGDPGNDEVRAGLPNGNKGLQIYLNCIHQSGEFAQAAEFPAWTDLKYRLFVRQTPAFSGFIDDSVAGLLPAYGPYPMWRLPITRAAFGDATRFSLPAGAIRRILVLSFVCHADDQKMTINLDGKTIATRTYQSDDQFQDIRLPLDLPAGVSHQLEIHYSKADWTKGAATILYKKIEIMNRQ